MFFLEALMTVLGRDSTGDLDRLHVLCFSARWALVFPYEAYGTHDVDPRGRGVVVLFLKKTFIGMAVKAASEDIVSTTLMGISPHRVNGVAFAIGIGLAGVAGVEVATVYSFDPFFGFIFVLKA